MQDLYIAEIYRPGLSSFTTIQPAPEYLYRWGGALSSFRVTEIGTKRKPVWNFLLVFHYNYMPIVCHFRVTTVYWWEIYAFLPFLTTPVSFEASQVVFSCDQGAKCGIKLEKLLDGRGRECLSQVSKSNFGVTWPWSLTSWPQNWIIWCLARWPLVYWFAFVFKISCSRFTK